MKNKFCETLSIGTSKLAVLVTLKTSKLNFAENRSVNRVAFTIETSARRCQGCRKMLRCPVVKLVSKVSPGAMAPPRSPGLSCGKVKHAALSAGDPGAAPLAPVRAFDGVQLPSGTTGLVMPSEVP